MMLLRRNCPPYTKKKETFLSPEREKGLLEFVQRDFVKITLNFL